jgi:hypothetical protein
MNLIRPAKRAVFLDPVQQFPVVCHLSPLILPGSHANDFIFLFSVSRENHAWISQAGQKQQARVYFPDIKECTKC